MSRCSALLQHLLTIIHEDLNDERADGEYLTNDTVEKLCDSVMEQCAAAVAKVKKAHNAGLPHARLPPEIWCHVWSLVPAQDLIEATHVCHAWRAIALDYAPFWKNVRFFTTVHERGSSCDDGLCDCQEAIAWELWEGDTPGPMHNLDKVETFLARSKGALLSMKVCIYPVFSEHRLATELAELVKPHAARIASLVCVFGDVSFFVDFMQEIKDFPSLDDLHMQRITYLEDEHNTWPMAKLELEHLEVPRLREFQGYGSFWWDIPHSPEARSLGALEHLFCNFSDARSFYDCLRACPDLLVLNAELDDHSAAHPPPVPLDEATLAPRLRELVMDLMTPLWEPAVRPIMRRSALRSLALQYSEYDAKTIFESLHHLEDGVDLSILGGLSRNDAVKLEAKDEHSKSRCIEFIIDTVDAQPALIALWHVWTFLPAQHLRTLKLSWVLRGMLLDSRIVAPGVSRIQLVVRGSDTRLRLGIDDLMALNDATVAGRPSFPNLVALEITSSTSGVLLTATSVREFAAALTDRECSIKLAGVELRDQV